MNQFFQLYGGSIAILSSIITTNIIARKWRKHRSDRARRHLVAVLYWGPILLMCCMVLHIINNGLNTIALIREGSGKFNFYQYSYQLFGAVLFYQSYLLLQKCRKHAEGTTRYNRSLYASMALILFTTLPTFIFTPIGIVPSVVLLINFVVSLLVHKSPIAEATPIKVSTVKVKTFAYAEAESQDV